MSVDVLNLRHFISSKRQEYGLPVGKVCHGAEDSAR